MSESKVIRPRREYSRFTAWLSPDEFNGITQMAQELSTSRNFVVRCAIRAALGLTLPTGLQFGDDNESDPGPPGQVHIDPSINGLPDSDESPPTGSVAGNVADHATLPKGETPSREHESSSRRIKHVIGIPADNK